jgi:hypothetical protein
MRVILRHYSPISLHHLIRLVVAYIIVQSHRMMLPRAKLV